MPQSFGHPAAPTTSGSVFARSVTAHLAWNELPHGYKVFFAPFRAAYSHSASVGSRYVTPSRLERHSANAVISSIFTNRTGFCSVPGTGLSLTQWARN